MTAATMTSAKVGYLPYSGLRQFAFDDAAPSTTADDDIRDDKHVARGIDALSSRTDFKMIVLPFTPEIFA